MILNLSQLHLLTVYDGYIVDYQSDVEVGKSKKYIILRRRFSVPCHTRSHSYDKFNTRQTDQIIKK